MEDKTVFISYRRALSKHLARSIYIDLRSNDWDVFLDVNTIDSGDFDRIILNQIGARVHFILLISTGSLQRCTNPGDWVLREIQEAVRLNRNIIPVIEEDVDFAQEMSYLTSDLCAIVSKKNSVRLLHDYFDEGVERLRTRFLKSPEYITLTKPPAREQAEVARRMAAFEAELKPSTNNTELIVDVRGRGSYTSISAALVAATPGAHIIVRPGIYQESVVINKPVTITGEGGVDQVIVHSAFGSCITMQTDVAVVSGLGLHCTAGTNGYQVFAVDIPQGRLTLNNCEITSNSLSCVGIRNILAQPHIINCQIHNSSQCGILVDHNGTGVIEDCQIYGNAINGVEIRNSGNPTIRNSTIINNKFYGVYAHDKGYGTIENCDLHSNEYGAFNIDSTSNLVERNNRKRKAWFGLG